MSDANAYNRRLAGASLDPAILVLEPVPSSVGMAPAVGLRIARVTF